MAKTAQQPVLVIMGVSGSGKSTVAGLVAGRLGWDLAEGDDLHPASNVAKMQAGEPLTDEDPVALAGNDRGLDPGPRRRGKRPA
ncbi:probable gluconokinase [Arthrobacter sp. Hiyo6]|nr:probable gluconokinase [Arthrobacter sp. Hiyo6]